MRSLFAYTDFRKYLRDFYLNKKKEKSSFTYKTFSDLAEIKSPNYLKLVIDGERKLMSDGILKFAKALGLNFDETQYFEALVCLSQAETSIEKNYYSQRVKLMSQQAGKHKVSVSQTELLEAWYLPAILICLGEPKATIEKVVTLTGLNRELVQSAIDHLIKIGMVTLENSSYTVIAAHVDIPGQSRGSQRIQNYLRSQIVRSLKAFDEQQKQGAKFYSHSFSIEESSFERFKERVQTFIDEMAEAAIPDRTEKLVQLNIQLFPVLSK